MKTQRFLLPLSCLLLVAGIGLSQNNVDSLPDAQYLGTQQSDVAMMTEEAVLNVIEVASIKAILRSYWNGHGTGIIATVLLQEPKFFPILGFSEEQGAQLANVWNSPQESEIFADSESFAMLAEEMQALLPGNWSAEKRAEFILDDDTMADIMKQAERVASFQVNTLTNVLDNILTTDQTQVIREFQAAAMGELPIVSPNMFEALDLNDAQRQEMEKIKKELEPEFEKSLDDFANNLMVLGRKLNSDQVKGIKFDDGQFVIESREETVKHLMVEDPEYKRIQEEIQTWSQTFSTQFKTRMFDVLNDEQWNRLQDLVDNPSEHVQFFLRHLKEGIGLDDSEKNEGGANKGAEDKIWLPGPGSWRPGDPIPEAYRQERNTRGNFPRTEN